MRVLVTGGAGYIGSITTRHLLDAGHECVVLDTLERGNRDAVDQRAVFVQGSVGDADVLGDVLPGCDAVMHLAGFIEVGESQLKPELYNRVNALEPLVMLDAMVDHGVDAIVFSSTAAVYGEPKTLPITEESATLPVNAYGESKLAFEQSLALYRERGLRAIRFRYFNVAGAWPGGLLGEAHDPETHLIPRILFSLRDGASRFELFGDDYPTRDGTCVRDYIHVLDLAQAHKLALERLHAGGDGDVFNLGNGDGFTNLEVIQACARVTGIEADVAVGPRRPGDPAVLVASAQKARDVLGWAPQRPHLDEMVSDAWRWHLARPNGYR